MPSKKFDLLCDELLKEILKVNPELGTTFGIHNPYDWQLPHGGFKKLEDTLTILKSWHSKAGELSKSEKLSMDQRLSLRGLEALIKITEFSIKDYPHWNTYPDAIQWVGELLFIMTTWEYAPYDQRISAVCSRLKRLPEYLEQFRTRFDREKTVHVWVNMAIDVCQEFPDFLRFIETSSKGRISESLMQDLAKEVRNAAAAVAKHLEWLKSLLDKPARDFPMGKKKFAKLLKIRGIGLTPDEVLALGEKYLKEFKKERIKVAERIAPGRGIEGAAEVVHSRLPRTFEDALKATEDEMNKAKQYITEHNIASIDPSAHLWVRETPSFLASILPFAAIFMPAMFDQKQEGIYIVTRPKEESGLGNRLNYAAITNTAVHEAYPGHFQQAVMSNKKHWSLQLLRTSEDIMHCGTETVEGWAHYCEKMMFDHGYEATDEAAYEMLTGAIWRACRIIADVKLAQGDATIEEMTEWMTKETGMPKTAMENEVKRYSHTPGQALSYMIGRHLIIEFRKDLEKKLGHKFDEKRFHDLVASYGYLPFNLVEEMVVSEFASS